MIFFISYCSAFKRAAFPISLRSSLSSINRQILSANTFSLLTGTRNPSCPSAMMSCGPQGQAYETTGTPQDMASMITNGRPSKSEVNVKIDASYNGEIYHKYILLRKYCLSIDCFLFVLPIQFLILLHPYF